MPIPVLTVEQMRAWETASWAAGIRAIDVIAQVGRRIGDWLLTHSTPEDAFIFLAGRGHNGDDARAASHWIGWRRNQRMISVTDPIAAAAEIAAELPRAAARAPRVWVIDALFGIGLNRPFTRPWCQLIEELNRQTAGRAFRVVAVDVPSGLTDDTGGTAGALVIATDTLTVGAPKRGLVGLAAAGRIEVLTDIGLAPAGGPHEPASPLDWCTEADFTNFPPRRLTAAHKGTQGHLLIVAGSPGYHGAAVLAARAALRAGPGLVTVVCDPAAYGPVAAQLAQPMVHAWREGFAPPVSVTAAVVGPGLAAPELPPGLQRWVQSLWRDFPGPVLADATALDWLPGRPTPAAPRILTPHPGETARLLGVSTQSVQADRVSAVRELSQRFRALAVLKGYQTLIADAATTTVNPTGNAGLAQGGTGDVLAGFIGGWLARGIPAERAVAYGVWAHGAAADRLTSHSTWTTEELLAELR